MVRVRSVAAVLAALLPGALVALLGFQAGGFYPDTWAPVAVVLAVALALRTVLVERPLASLGPWLAVAAAALGLLAVWVLASSSWSHAPGRATVEYVRVLTYLLVLLTCGSLVPLAGRLAWGIRGVAVAIAAVCAAGLVSRLRPDLLLETGLAPARLDFPITYWNGMGFLAGVGAVLALHLSASSREPWPLRIAAAGLVPLAACALYFTLSRGGIASTAIGLGVYLACGFSRATPGALLAVVPPTAIALSKAYGAERLVSADYADAAGRAQGRDVLLALVLCIVAAMWLRALALLVDRLMERAPSLGRLPIGVRAGMAAGAVAAVVLVAVVAGAPGAARTQADRFLHSGVASGGPDIRDRLTDISSNGRADNWKVAIAAWRAEKLHGTGAGTYQNEWNRRRTIGLEVTDAHSLYLESLSDLGVVGLLLVLVAIGAVLAGLCVRLAGPQRPCVAAVLAAVTAWAAHAGVDWDWELTAVSVWVFGLAGLALSRPAPERRARDFARPLRLVAALGCLLLALTPFSLWRSQHQLSAAVRAFTAGDCPATIDAALSSLSALNARPEPWELVAYCDVRLGQPALARGAAQAAVARDPGDWEYRYAQALVQGVTGKDPRAAAARALALNPREPLARGAVRAFAGRRPARWERRARRLPLYIR